MAHPQKCALRPLLDDERTTLGELSRSQSAPAAHVVRAQILLSVAQGMSFVAAARAVGRRDADPVAWLVRRFNAEGLEAVIPRHGGGTLTYGVAERARIIQEFRRTPDVARDGTKTWSLSLLQRALRAADDGLPRVSTWTIGQTLHTAGFSWQRSRTWCATGTVVRKRKTGQVTVTDPEADAKKGR